MQVLVPKGAPLAAAFRVLARQARGASVGVADGRAYALRDPPVTGVAPVVRKLLAGSPMLGSAGAEEREVGQWIDGVEAASEAALAALPRLSARLLAVTYLGNTVAASAADVLWYAAVCGCLRALAPPQRAEFLPVLRWAHTVELSAYTGEDAVPAAEQVGPPAAPAGAGGAKDRRAANKPSADEIARRKAEAAAAKKDKPAKEGGAKGGGGGKGIPERKDLDPSAFDIRVGKIVEAQKHETADKLYVERIDVGEAEPRLICSGLAKFLPLDKVLGRTILVMCNLKPAKLVGTMSNGMVVCSQDDPEEPTSVDFVGVPDGAKVGDQVSFAGFPAAPPAQIPPKKLPDLISHLHTDSSGQMRWKESLCTIGGKPCVGVHKGARVK